MRFAQLNIKYTLKINRLQYVFVILDVYKGVMHMALHKIDIAIGPEATLNALSEKYPERGFLKYRSADDRRKVHTTGRLRREDGLPVRTELQGHAVHH